MTVEIKHEIAMRRKRVHVHAPGTVGQHVADSVATAIGSWRFIILQTIVVVLWCVLNTVAFAEHWDPYPWILLNLLFSTQAAYTGPVLLLASNRQAQKDRLRDDRDDEEIGEILEVSRTTHVMQKEQMQSHAAQREKLDAILKVVSALALQ